MLFFSFTRMHFKWEMNEQLYQELKQKRAKGRCSETRPTLILNKNAHEKNTLSDLIIRNPWNSCVKEAVQGCPIPNQPQLPLPLKGRSSMIIF